MAWTTYESYTGLNPTGIQIPFYAANADKLGQTFTVQAGEDHVLGEVQLYIARLSLPRTIYVDIYATDGGTGYPTGSSLGTSSVDGDSISNSAAWVVFAFSPVIELTAGVTYAIVLTVPIGYYGEPPRGIYWFKGAEAGYGDGKPVQYNLDGTPTWTSPADTDLYFRECGHGLPGKPTNPSPSDTDTDITLDETPLSWDASADDVADTYEIYLREQGEDWELVGVAQAGVEWVVDFGTLDYDITYEWRVDATNAAGTTEGDTWTFDSIAFDPPTAGTGGGGGGTGEESSPTGENNMITLRRLVAAAQNKIWYEDI